MLLYGWEIGNILDNETKPNFIAGFFTTTVIKCKKVAPQIGKVIVYVLSNSSKDCGNTSTKIQFILRIIRLERVATPSYYTSTIP